MRKHLIRIGNSYAIIIDKSIRRLLHLGPRAILEVSTDGERIVIQPTGKLLQDDEIGRAREILSAEEGMPARRRAPHVNRAALDLDAPHVWNELEGRYAITTDRLVRLHHETQLRFVRVASWMRSPRCATNANVDELATIQRLKACRDRLRAGDTWDTAIAAAVAAFPRPNVVASRQAASASTASAS
jgi:hypothetical protein